MQNPGFNKPKKVMKTKYMYETRYPRRRKQKEGKEKKKETKGRKQLKTCKGKQVLMKSR